MEAQGKRWEQGGFRFRKQIDYVFLLVGIQLFCTLFPYVKQHNVANGRKHVTNPKDRKLARL